MTISVNDNINSAFGTSQGINKRALQETAFLHLDYVAWQSSHCLNSSTVFQPWKADKAGEVADSKSAFYMGLHEAMLMKYSRLLLFEDCDIILLA